MSNAVLLNLRGTPLHCIIMNHLWGCAEKDLLLSSANLIQLSDIGGGVFHSSEMEGDKDKKEPVPFLPLLFAHHDIYIDV